MAKDKKLPAMQFYPGDWRKAVDIQSLSFNDRGVWFEMLMLMHDSERRGLLILNGVAMPDDMIARAIGLDNQTFNQSLTTLLTYGVASREPNTGAIMSRRMVRDESIRQIRTEAGFKGGNPALLNQKSTTQVKQKSTPSSSSSSSSSEVSTGVADATSPNLEGTGISENNFKSYLAVRKLKKSPFADENAREKFLVRMRNRFDNGFDTADMLDQMIVGGWIGPVEDKWKKRDGKTFRSTAEVIPPHIQAYIAASNGGPKL